MYLVIETIIKDTNRPNTVGENTVLKLFNNFIQGTGYANRIITERMKKGFTSKSIGKSYNLLSLGNYHTRRLQMIEVEEGHIYE